MKDKSKSYFIALAAAALVLFLILVPSAASALPLTITETQITTSGSASNPDIYEGKIVYHDERNGGSNIYMYDRSTKKETQITKYDTNYNPAIYDNKIVYTWGSTTDVDYLIYMYDLSTKNTISMGTFTPNDGMYPAIYGSRIVWEDAYIWMHDLSTNIDTQISSKQFVYNPVIYEDKIVWEDHRDRDYSYIYMYDLSTQNETQITSNGSASNPHIYGDRIVWQDSRNGKSDIYMYDLSTKNETKITTGGSASNPAIYGDRIVWQDSRNGKSNIYMATLSSKPAIVAAFYASPVSGKVPLTVKFTDKSTGSSASYLWNFGDKYTSTVKNPVHKYTKAGKYTVTLKVTSAAGSNTVTKSSYINVLTPPVAAFSAYPVSGKTVKFTDKSTNNPTSWYWNFGDKTTSKLQSPVHKYTQAGIKYTVSLTVKNAAGSSTAKKTITTLR